MNDVQTVVLNESVPEAVGFVELWWPVVWPMLLALAVGGGVRVGVDGAEEAQVGFAGDSVGGGAVFAGGGAGMGGVPVVRGGAEASRVVRVGGGGDG